MRRILAIALLLAVVVATGWTLYRWNRSGSVRTSPWRAIPERAAAVIIIPDGFRTWDRVSHTAQLWAYALQVPAAAAVEQFLTRLRASMENHAATRSALEGGEVHVCLMRNGGNELGCLITGSLEGAGPGSLKGLHDVLGLDATATAALAAGNVVPLQVDTALPTLSLCIREGVWMLGNSAAMMDEALLQWDNPRGLQHDSAFIAALRTLGGGSDGHLIFRGDRLTQVAHLYWSPEALDGIPLDDRWVALDIRSRADMLLLSGIVPGPADRSPFTELHSQRPGPVDGARVLPRRTMTCSTWHISDPASLSRKGDSIPEAVGFHDWVMGTSALAVAEGVANTRWAVLHTSDPDLAEERLMSLCPEGCDTLGYRGSMLRRLPPEPAVAGILKDPDAPWNDAWWTLLGQAVVMSDSLSALRESVDAWSDGRSLAEDARTTAWWARMGTESGMTWWADVGRAGGTLKALLREPARAAWERYGSFWDVIGNLSVHLNPGQRGCTHLTVAIQCAPLIESEQDGSVQDRWVVELQAPLSRSPQVVTNHTNGSREVLVQDDLNRLHLIGSNGRVIWTRELDGPILGSVRQIDRFSNGKLQLLFNTSGTIQLIDRNGHDVQGFPVKLDHPSSAPLSAFDYDGNGEHRILVPLVNGTLENRGADGRRITGWEGGRAGFSTHPVEHLRIHTKDHLVVVDTSGIVHIMDRRGALRERAPLKVDREATILAIDAGLSLEQSEVRWQDGSGALHRGSFKGEKELLGGAGIRNLAGPGGLEGPPVVAELFADSVLLRRGSVSLNKAWLPGAAEATNAGWYDGEGETMFGLVVDGSLHGWGVDGMPIPGSPFKARGGWCLGDLDRDGQRELVVAEPGGRIRCLTVPAP
jgi:hypothetical protein